MGMKSFKELIRQLNESPSIVPPLDFALGDDSGNAWRLRELVSGAKLIETKRVKNLLDEETEVSIFKSNDSIYAVSDKKIVFLVTLEEGTLGKPFDIKYATQIEVWRNPSEAVGLTSYIFWKYVFPIQNVVISDESQTEDGKRFWKGITQKAKKNGLNVYRIDVWKNLIIKSKTDEDMFGSDTYGKGDFFKRFRLVITKDNKLDSLL